MEVEIMEHEHKEHEHREHEHKEVHHTEVHHTAPTGATNATLWVMAIALGLLIIVAGIQAVEMVSLKNKLTNDISALGASKPSVSGGLSKNLESLPSMVGGC